MPLRARNVMIPASVMRKLAFEFGQGENIMLLTSLPLWVVNLPVEVTLQFQLIKPVRPTLKVRFRRPGRELVAAIRPSTDAEEAKNLPHNPAAAHPYCGPSVQAIRVLLTTSRRLTIHACSESYLMRGARHASYEVSSAILARKVSRCTGL